MKKEPGHRETQSRDGLIAGALLTVFGLAGFIGILIYYNQKLPLASQSEPPPMPAGIPGDVPWLGAFEREIRVDDESFLVPYGVEASIKVIFPSQDSIKGLWSGDHPEFAMLEPSPKKFRAESQKESWGGLLLTQGTDLYSFTPWMKAAFSMDKKHLHQWVTVNAKLGMVYPVFADVAGKFIDRSGILQHTFRLYVTSPEEYQMVLNYKEWEGSQSLADPGMGYFFSALCFVPGIFILIIEILSIRKRRRRQAG